MFISSVPPNVRSTRWSKGQGLIETALLLPLLLVILSGLAEFGFMLVEYLTIQDAVRNAARFSSDSLYDFRDNIHNCDPTLGAATIDFYRQTACLVNDELRLERPLITLNDNGTAGTVRDDYLDPARGDDIVISAFSMLENFGVSARHPSVFGELGWSYALDFPGYTTRNATSNFRSEEITQRWLHEDSANSRSTPNTGLLIIELVYHYDQKLKLPWITAIVPDPVPLRFFAIMPLVSAEPTPTPAP